MRLGAQFDPQNGSKATQGINRVSYAMILPMVK